MRKLYYIGFCAVLAMGFGCALSNYFVITNEYDGTIIDTNGKAHIMSTFFGQVALLWPDGNDNAQWYLNQQSDATSVIQTYNYFTDPGANPFTSSIYCTPEWNGCAIVTCQDTNDAADLPFDYSANFNCDGARSIYYLLDASIYSRSGSYRECGRATRPTLSEQLDFLASGQAGQAFGQTGLWFNWNRGNTTIRLDNLSGFSTTLPFNSSGRFFMSPRTGHTVLELDSPMLASDTRLYAKFLADHGTAATSVTITYNGVSMPFRIAGNLSPNDPISSPSAVLKRANTR